MPKEVWKQIHDQNQQIPGGGVITWRRSRPTDGAALPQKSLIRLQAQGISLGFRTQRHMEELFCPIGLLRGIVCDGIRVGDPNWICVDVEMIDDREIPGNLCLEMGGGISVDIKLALKPHAPLPNCTQSASSSSPKSPTAQMQASGEQQKSVSLTTRAHDSPPKMQQDHMPSPGATPKEDPAPKIQGISIAASGGGPRDSLSVYHARRRYRSVPASPGTHNSWHRNQDQNQQPMSKGPTLEDPPSLTALGPPGSRDITMPELLQIIQAATEGGDAHIPQ